MSVSLRRYRAAIYAYTNTGTGGRTNELYVQQASTAADKCFWASKAVPTGRERTVGLKAEERVDAVLGFDAHTPVVPGSVAVIGALTFRALAVLPRDNGRDDLQVLAMACPASAFTLQAAP